MDTTQAAIAENIEARQHAEAVLELAELAGRSERFLLAFWREMQKRSIEVVPLPQSETLRTMTDEQAASYEKLTIRYGIHSGKQYGDVPISYLTWIADNALDLQAYIRSKRGQDRVAADD